jgi:L-lysine 2,3-aminomutase
MACPEMRTQTGPASVDDTAPRERNALIRPEQLAGYVPGLSPRRLEEARVVAERFPFRIPLFYAQRILTGDPEDPLLALVLPSGSELEDGDELWDSTASPYRASDSPFWVQKYEFQGLLRVTTACSGLCRFCYLKRKNAEPRVMTIRDVDELFDDLEIRGRKLREIILSGGDPLCAPPDVLEAIARRVERLRAVSSCSIHLNIHTREPVWDPERMVRRSSLLGALALLKPKIFVINVIHPREVTPEFERACAVLNEACGPTSRPLFLCQHPLFRGVNDSVTVLEDLYGRLLSCSPPVLPYYLVHPFYNGTLPQHRLSIEDSQRLYRELARRPGCMLPKLVVPTPWGKCIIGPHEDLRRTASGVELFTKDGVRVFVP